MKFRDLDVSQEDHDVVKQTINNVLALHKNFDRYALHTDEGVLTSVIDLETGGTDELNGSIVLSIGIVTKDHKGNIVGSFQTKLRQADSKKLGLDWTQDTLDWHMKLPEAAQKENLEPKGEENPGRGVK